MYVLQYSICSCLRATEKDICTSGRPKMGRPALVSSISSKITENIDEYSKCTFAWYLYASSLDVFFVRTRLPYFSATVLAIF